MATLKSRPWVTRFQSPYITLLVLSPLLGLEVLRRLPPLSSWRALPGSPPAVVPLQLDPEIWSWPHLREPWTGVGLPPTPAPSKPGSLIKDTISCQQRTCLEFFTCLVNSVKPTNPGHPGSQLLHTFQALSRGWGGSVGSQALACVGWLFYFIFFQASGDIDRVREIPGRWLLQLVTQCSVPCPFPHQLPESDGLREEVSLFSLI